MTQKHTSSREHAQYLAALTAQRDALRAENAKLREALRCVAIGKPYAKRAAELLESLPERL